MYVEVCQGVTDRNNFLPWNAETLSRFRGKSDIYHSLFQFPVKPKDIKEPYLPCKASHFIIDIDMDGQTIEERVDKARKEVVDMLTYLEQMYDLDLSIPVIWFSGNKGFHVSIHEQVFGGFTARIDFPDILKNFAVEILNGFHFDTVIYNKSRIIRMPFTRHTKSGLYKVPFHFNDINSMSVKEILEMAESVPNNYEPNFDFEPNETLAEIWEKFCHEPQRKPTFSPTNEEIHKNVENNQRWREKPCIRSILNNGITQGSRHNLMMRISNDLWKRGFDESVVTAFIEAYNNTNVKPPLDEKHLHRIIEDSKRFDYGCNDEILKAYCSNKCPLKKHEDSQQKILTIDEMHQEYYSFINHADKNKIILDHWLPITQFCRGFYPGEVIIIIGGTGTGKTAFAQNMVHNIALPSVFFSFELPPTLLYERHIAIGEDLPVSQVEELYKKRSFREEALQRYSHHYFVTEPMTLEEIEETILAIREASATDLKVAVIDYLSLIKYTNKSGAYERTSDIARELKYVAKRTNTLLVVLAQVNRGNGSGTVPLTRNDARDSGAIEEVADMLIGIWRPERDRATDHPDNYHIGILKNRKGKEGLEIIASYYKEKLIIKDVKQIRVLGA